MTFACVWRSLFLLLLINLFIFYYFFTYNFLIFNYTIFFTKKIHIYIYFLFLIPYWSYFLSFPQRLQLENAFSPIYSSSSVNHSPYQWIADLSVYITRFQWDMAKYPIKQSLRNIADIISKQIGQIDADLKTKSTAYNSLKGNLQNLEKKQT